jgi:hypothetical protein
MDDSDGLIDHLRDKFSSEIIHIIRECQEPTKGYLDIEKLNESLLAIPIITTANALTEEDWFDLIYEFVPEVYNVIAYKKFVA